jgi:uncharacterized coiled-coil protein SlyX
MPNEDEQNKEHSKISVRIGEVQVELEGTYENIKKLMGKELFDFTKELQETKKQLPPSTEITPEVKPKAPEITPKAPEVTPKEKTVPPPSKPSTTAEALSQKPRVSAIGKTTEKGGRKKIVSRTMVIALGMICIVLVAGLVGAIAVYMPMVSNLESQIAEKDNTIFSLNSQVSSLNSQVSSLQANFEQLNSTIEDYQEAIEAFNQQVSYYLSVIYLNESGYLFATQTLTQDANASTVVYDDNIRYAGYVSVAVESNSTTTYALVMYSSYGVEYNHNVTVGTGGTAVFPVLPGEILIGVGNTEPVENVTAVAATVTASYSY